MEFSFDAVFQYVRFERPFAIYAIPFVVALGYWIFRAVTKSELRSVPQGLEEWVENVRSRGMEIFQHATAALVIGTTFAGLGGLQLLLLAAEPPLHNIGMIVMLDGSDSMRAEEDVFGAGGRFETAKRDIVEEFAPLIQEKVRPRMGFILFAGGTRRSFTLYDDYGVFLAQVSSATVMPSNDQGTNFVGALRDAFKLCNDAKDLVSCAAVLVTDGDLEAYAEGLFEEVLPKFRERQWRLDVIGVGKRAAPLPSLGERGVPLQFNPETGEVTPEVTQYDPKFLRKIADAGGGEFYEAGERGGVRRHLQKIRGAVEGAIKEQTRQWTDATDYCFMASAVFLMVLLITFVPFARVRASFRKR